MKEVNISGVHDAAQLSIGLKLEHDKVMIAMEAPPPDGHPVHWLTYKCDAVRARDIAQTLIQGADILEGIQPVPTSEIDDAADNFREHKHG